MFYETAKNDHGLPYNPIKAIVAPRPIGWIISMSGKGEINLAPYSFFNAVSDSPRIVLFSTERINVTAIASRYLAAPRRSHSDNLSNAQPQRVCVPL